jgi:hypothetical protein
MGMGESDDSGKRKIIVGFFEPPEYEREGDTIYVCLQPYGSSQIGAVAVSNTEFKYQTKAIAGNSLEEKRRKASNMASCSRGGLPACDPHYEIFIARLVKRNNGEVVYRTLEDGIELSRRIIEIQRQSDLSQKL